MSKFFQFFSGKKSYLLGLLAVVWGVVGWAAGWLEPLEAQKIIWGGLAVFSLRAGVAGIAKS